MKAIKLIIIFLLSTSITLNPFAFVKRADADGNTPFVYVDPGLFAPPQGTLSIETLSFTCNSYESGWLELRGQSTYSTNDGNGPVAYDKTESLWLDFSVLQPDQMDEDWNQAEVQDYLESVGFFQNELPNNIEVGNISYSTHANPLELALEAESLGSNGFGYIGENIGNWFNDCLDTHLTSLNISSFLNIDPQLDGSLFLRNENNSLSHGNFQEVSSPQNLAFGQLWETVKKIAKTKAFKRAVGIFQGLGLVVAIVQGEWARAAYEAIELLVVLIPGVGPPLAGAFLILDILEFISELLGYSLWCNFVHAFGIPASWAPECYDNENPEVLPLPNPEESVIPSLIVVPSNPDNVWFWYE